MTRLARSFIVRALALCVTAALVVPPLYEQIATWSFARGGARSGDASESSRPSARSTERMVAAMHARNEAELRATVATIRDDFGMDATPAQFSSHHVARDYLERLRLAREARARGLDVDPHAFGDDAAMRRHIAALRRGETPFVPQRVTADGIHRGAPAGAETGRRDCVFIYGHRYYRDEQGRYVRADGTILQTALVRPRRPGPPGGAPVDQAGSVLPPDLLDYDIDALLEMLGAVQSSVEDATATNNDR